MESRGAFKKVRRQLTTRSLLGNLRPKRSVSLLLKITQTTFFLTPLFWSLRTTNSDFKERNPQPYCNLSSIERQLELTAGIHALDPDETCGLVVNQWW